MYALHVIVTLVVIALFVYLIVALLSPERFE